MPNAQEAIQPGPSGRTGVHNPGASQHGWPEVDTSSLQAKQRGRGQRLGENRGSAGHPRATLAQLSSRRVRFPVCRVSVVTLSLRRKEDGA